MPEVEIDIDDLLDADSEEERASKLQVNSFQNLEFSDHGCLGFQSLGITGACLVGTLSVPRSGAMAVCKSESIAASLSPSIACLIIKYVDNRQFSRDLLASGWCSQGVLSWEGELALP